jgi:hypothetical protein
MNETECAYSLIEEKRTEMMFLAGLLGYTNLDTIKASQELDSLMNAQVSMKSLTLSLKD